MSILKVNSIKPGVLRPFRVSDLQEVWTALNQIHTGTAKPNTPYIISGFNVDPSNSGAFTAGVVLYNDQLYDAPGDTYGVTMYFNEHPSDDRLFNDGTINPFYFSYALSIDDPTATVFGPVTKAFIEENRMPATIPDGSVATAKLADGAVTHNKIANRAIVSTKIAPYAVSTHQIAPEAVTGDGMFLYSVGRRAYYRFNLSVTAATGWKSFTSTVETIYGNANLLSSVVILEESMASPREPAFFIRFRHNNANNTARYVVNMRPMMGISDMNRSRVYVPIVVSNVVNMIGCVDMTAFFPLLNSFDARAFLFECEIWAETVI